LSDEFFSYWNADCNDAITGIGKPIAEEPQTLPSGVIIDLMPTMTTPDPTTTPTPPSAETTTSSETAAETNETADATTTTTTTAE
jgi:hypothetical protein